MRSGSLVQTVAGGAFVLVCVASSGFAEPLALPGDRVLRQDVEVLKAYGLIPGTTDTWPLSWSQLADSLAARGSEVPPHVEAAAQRVLDQRPLPDTVRLESSGAFTSRRSLIFGFDGGARDDADVSAGVQTTWKRTTGRLVLGYRSGGEEDKLLLEGSYLAQGVGNWVIWGGAVDRWYGPGWDAGLVLSRNAEPIPGIGVFRSVPRRSGSWLLRWMGPWRFDGFFGVVDGHRNDFQNPVSINLQLAFEPWRRFDVALSRGIMICGEGRPCGLEEWARAVFALFDLDNQDTPGKQDPSNQNASVSFAYTFLPGDVRVTPLLEWYFEDEFNYVSILLGTRVLVPHGASTWRFQLEYSDTYANRILGILGSSWLAPTATYTYAHFIYTDGYTHEGLDIGHSLGGDGRLITLESGWVGGNGCDLVGRVRFVDSRINPRALATPVLRDTWVVEAGGGVALGSGRLGAALRWTEEHPFDTGGDSWEVEGSYRIRFDTVR